MRARAAITLTVTVLVAVGSAACSGGGGSGDSVPATTEVPATAPTAPPTTAAPATTTTVALIPQLTPDVAANALLKAWHDGDRHAALVVATPAAADALFAQAPQSYSDRGCQDPLNGRAECAFGIGGEAAIAQVGTVSLAGGWVVDSVTVAANQ